MFSHDTADRTLPPTERRRREARARGDVVRSAELTTALTLLAGSLAFWWLVPTLGRDLVSLTRRALTAGPSVSLTLPAMTQLVQQTALSLLVLLIPFAILVLACAVLANLVQTGWVWNLAAVAPRMRFRALFSWERLVDVSGVMLRLGLLGTVAWFFASSRYSQVLSLGQGEPVAVLVRSARLIGELLIQLSTCLVVVALADYSVRFWRHEQRLKMTIEERRQEQKDDQIDPGIKRRRADSRSQSVAPVELVESSGGIRR